MIVVLRLDTISSQATKSRFVCIWIVSGSFDLIFKLSSIMVMQKRVPYICKDAPTIREHRESEAPRSFLLSFVRSLAIASARKDHREEMERRESERE